MSLAKKHLSQRKKQQRALAIFLLLPAALIISVVTIYPLIHSFWLSLHKWDLMKPLEGHPFVGLENYRFVFNDPTFWDSAKISIIFVISAVTLEIVLGMAIALLLNKDFFGKSFVRMLALLPWAIPPVVNGIMWKWILNPSYGALNGLLYSLGIIDNYVIWLGSKGLALVMVVLADVWKETPFIMLLFLSALQTIPNDLYEAAKVDGANPVTTLFKITIPMIRPTLFVAVALRTIWALKSFDLIYTLTSGGPSGGTSVIGYYTYIKTFVSLNLGRGAAVAYIMTFVVAGLVLVYQRLLYRKEV